MAGKDNYSRMGKGLWTTAPVNLGEPFLNNFYILNNFLKDISYAGNHFLTQPLLFDIKNLFTPKNL